MTDTDKRIEQIKKLIVAVPESCADINTHCHCSALHLHCEFLITQLAAEREKREKAEDEIKRLRDALETVRGIAGKINHETPPASTLNRVHMIWDTIRYALKAREK